jgi:hypothetical protein
MKKRGGIQNEILDLTVPTRHGKEVRKKKRTDGELANLSNFGVRT